MSSSKRSRTRATARVPWWPPQSAKRPSLIQGNVAIHGFANIMKDSIRNGCLQIAGADALEYTREPATLQEIIQMFGPSSVKILRDDTGSG
jgi:hypothetical protein